MNKLLIEKYEPRFLEDFNYDRDYIEYIDSITRDTDLNILLYGNLGSGKTLLINAILYRYYGVQTMKDIKNNILYISSLKEQGVTFLKNDVKSFCQSTSEIYGKKKCIVIDNIDCLNENNQNIFKIHMDTYCKRVIFLSSCTNINKVNQTLLNHFIVIKMKTIDYDILDYTFEKIASKEGINISSSLKSLMIKYSNNSIKLLINNLEKYRLLHDKIEFKEVNIINNILVKELVEFFNLTLKLDRDNSYKKLLDIFKDGYSLIDIIEYMYINLKFNDRIHIEKKYVIIKVLSKYLIRVNNTYEDELIVYFLTNDIIENIETIETIE